MISPGPEPALPLSKWHILSRTWALITAPPLYRAERLQERGQNKMGLKYFKEVLQTKPDCVEAKENARISLGDDSRATKESAKFFYKRNPGIGTILQYDRDGRVLV